MATNSPDLAVLAQRVAYWFARIRFHQSQLMKLHAEYINSVTGCLKDGVVRWKYRMDEECLKADLSDAQVQFNQASVAHGNAMRAAMNGQSLHTHDVQEKLRAEAAPVSTPKREVPADR